MRCLSVRQPWASLIASGRKTVELRSKPTRYRGDIVICAALGADRLHVERWGDGPRGVAVALVELVDCDLATEGDAFAACHPATGFYAWRLRLVGALPAVPVKGQLSMFAPGDEVTRAVVELRRRSA